MRDELTVTQEEYQRRARQVRTRQDYSDMFYSVTVSCNQIAEKYPEILARASDTDQRTEAALSRGMAQYD